MLISTAIKTVIASNNLTMSATAEKIGQDKSNFSKKLVNNTIGIKDILTILDLFDAELQIVTKDNNIYKITKE